MRGKYKEKLSVERKLRLKCVFTAKANTKQCVKQYDHVGIISIWSH